MAGISWASFSSNVSLFMPPDAFRTESEQKLQMQLRVENDPERPPKKRPGDDRIFKGLLLGLVIGAGVGVAVSYLLGFANPVGALFLGALSGGVVGTLVARRTKRVAR